MKREEAYRVLGLHENATDNEVLEAFLKKVNRVEEFSQDDKEYMRKKRKELKLARDILLRKSTPGEGQDYTMKFESAEPDDELLRDAKQTAENLLEKGIEIEKYVTLEEEEFLAKIMDTDVAAEKEKIAKNDSEWTYEQILEIEVIQKHGVDSPEHKEYLESLSFEYSKNKNTQSTLTSKSPVGIMIALVVLFTYFWFFPIEAKEYSEYQDEFVAIDAHSEAYDYETYLDYSLQPQMKKYVDYLSETNYVDEEGRLIQLADALGIGEYYFVMEYNGTVKEEETVINETSDNEYGEALAELMDAPEFKDIAGALNVYSEKNILNYEDYLIFLTDVAENQTEAILAE